MLPADSIQSLISVSESTQTIIQPKAKKKWTAKYIAKRDSIARADSLARFDSIAKCDSLAKLDSIRRTDSLKTVIEVHSGFEGKTLPTVPQNTHWIFGILLALFFILIVSLSLSSGKLGESIKQLFRIKERENTYIKHTAREYYMRFLLIIFGTTIFSICAYLTLFQNTHTISIEKYGIFLGITFLFVLFKVLSFHFIAFIFLEKARFDQAKGNYFTIVSFLSICLYPLLLIYIYGVPYLQHYIFITMLILCVLASILIAIKLFQIFFNKTLASFYILLYLCTLEILPLIALYQVYKLTA